MQLVCEGNFCDDGLHVVIASVVNGARPLTTLSRTLTGRCTCEGEHTPACVEHFHHKCFTVPLELARRAARRWSEQKIDATAIDELLCEGDRGFQIATALRTAVFAKRHIERLTRACNKGLACSALVAILHLVPRDTALSAPMCVHSIEDAHAAAELRAYQRWLTIGRGSRSQRWAAQIALETERACARLPRETVDTVLYYVFE